MKDFISVGGRHYREKKTSMIELLSIVDYYDVNDLEKIAKVSEFALEHTEVEIEGVWLNVKAKGKDSYMPANLDEDVIEMRDIIQWYMSEVLMPVFQKSIESAKKRAESMDKASK